MLYWLSRAQAKLVPPATREGAVLVDLGCGGGLLAPHIAGKGYRHVGVDLIVSGQEQARDHGIEVLQADVAKLPFATASADVVCEAELLEHTPDVAGTVAEACRILRPGGLLLISTLNDTPLARLLAVRVAERIFPIVRGLHDPDLFVDPRVLRAECARHGVDLTVRGIRPAAAALARWMVTRRNAVPIVTTWSTAVMYQGCGTKKREEGAP